MTPIFYPRLVEKFRVQYRLWLLLPVCVAFLGSGGCIRETHLIGDRGSDDAAAPSPDVMGGSVAPKGAPPSAGGGAGGASAPAPTVVSLGDKASVGWPIAISPQEVARRLSEFLLRKPPTAAFTAAVVASAPQTNEDVGQLTDGLFLNEGSVAGRQAFYRWWLTLDDFPKLPRDPTLFPAYSVPLGMTLVEHTLLFTEDVTWRPMGGTLSTLLTEPTAFVTGATAPWYPGAPAVTGAEPTKVMLDPSQTAGLLTQPAVVATHDYSTRSEPTMRGLDLLERLLCNQVPPHPTAVPKPPTFAAGMTVRQFVEMETTTGPNCQNCHRILDPPGFAFGHFDAVGSFQKTEGGLPIDTSGVLPSALSATGATVPFTGVAALARGYAQAPEVRTCFAAQWLAFALGRFDSMTKALSDTRPEGTLASDAAYIVKRATIGGELNLRGTIRAVTETHAFLAQSP